MAGVGFALKRMMTDHGLAGAAAGAGHGAMVAAGPWLITLALLGLVQVAMAASANPDLLPFQAVLVYAVCFSNLVAAPVVMVATRRLSDALFAAMPEDGPPLLLAAIVTVVPPALGLGVVLFCWAGGLGGIAALLATATVPLLATIWVANLFLTTIRRFGLVSLAYLIGFGIAAGLIWLWSDKGLIGMLAGLDAGLAILAAILLGCILGEFPGRLGWPRDWSTAFRRYRLLAVAGLLGVAALWVDKWLMWTTASARPALGGLTLNPLYDAASFLGLATLIPALVTMLVTVETSFHTAHRRMMASAVHHATWQRLDADRDEVRRTLVQAARALVIVQVVVAWVVWFPAPLILDALHIDLRQLWVFRFIVIGALFHAVALLAATVLSYYDLRREGAMLAAIFFLGNLVATLIGIAVGDSLWGWGYLAGALAAACYGVATLTLATGDLLYLVFVRNNPAVIGDGGR